MNVYSFAFQADVSHGERETECESVIRADISRRAKPFRQRAV